MPKHRKRQNRSGAKSIAIRTKYKLGGRRSGKGALQLSDTELQELQSKVRKKDRNKLNRALAFRGLV